MNGWEALAHLGTVFLWFLAAVYSWLLIWMLTVHIRDVLVRRSNAAKAWREGYEQGVNDERLAAAVDIPEYRIPNRQNPYGKSESPTPS